MHARRVSVTTRMVPSVALCCCGLGASACVADEQQIIVGSGKVTEIAVDAALVEKAAISVPFTALVYDGEAGKIVLRGEDNVIARIDVTETDHRAWEIAVPADLSFEPHDDVEIEMPYIDMIELTLAGDSIQLVDDPAKVWHRGD